MAFLEMAFLTMIIRYGRTVTDGQKSQVDIHIVRTAETVFQYIPVRFIFVFVFLPFCHFCHFTILWTLTSEIKNQKNSYAMHGFLTLSWRRPLSYRNQSIDLRTVSVMKGLKKKIRLMAFNIDDYWKPMIKGLENVTWLVFYWLDFTSKSSFHGSTSHRCYILATFHFHFSCRRGNI